jgi:hypothetical protein
MEEEKVKPELLKTMDDIELMKLQADLWQEARRRGIDIRPDVDRMASGIQGRIANEAARLSPEALDLLDWWMATSFTDFMATVPKIFEYGGNDKRPGSADLRIVGESLMELLGWPVNEKTEAVAQELGCWFYLLGKSGRLVSNYQQQDPGKPDTWFDIGIYAKMARRIQETGNWP